MKVDSPKFGGLGNWRTLWAAAFSTLMAAIGVAAYWGFTVDDALITARVAHNIAEGHGYRFNPSGAVVDAVTPLGWAFLLAPFAGPGPFRAFLAARWIGTFAWLASAGWLGASVARRGVSIWPFALLAVVSPLGLWASAGMETAVVVALVTLATADGVLGLCCVGLAAAWRPELIPFAFVLSVGRCQSLTRIPRALALSVGPAVAVAILRWACFGSPHPLAVVAKPSDFTHGFWYALEALLWSGPVWLWLSPVGPWSPAGRGRRSDDAILQARHCPQSLVGHVGDVVGRPALERREAALVAAILVHFVAIALAGGDWMPAYRLAVPVMPAMLRVACHLAHNRGRLLGGIALILALASSLRVSLKLVPSARWIVTQRTALIRSAAHALQGASVVAAPDVGWVGVAFPAEIVDLAGATDPSVAYLRGGHTSKQIERRLLLLRQVDRIVVLLAPMADLKEPWIQSTFARAIDHRAALIGAELGCVPAETLRMSHTQQSYLILNCPKE